MIRTVVKVLEARELEGVTDGSAALDAAVGTAGAVGVISTGEVYCEGLSDLEAIGVLGTAAVGRGWTLFGSTVDRMV